MLNKVDTIVFTDNLDVIQNENFGEENRFCLIACLSGSVQLTREDKNFVVKKGEMAIWQVEELVGNYMRTPDFTGYLLSIGNETMKELLIEVCRVEPRWLEILRMLQANPVLTVDDEHYRKLMRSYFDLLKLYMQGEQTAYRKQTYMLLARAASFEVIAMMDKKIRKTENVECFTAGDRLVRDFAEMLREDDGTHREVAWYADKLNITPKYLSHVCKEKAKMTASGIIQQITAERIKHYLMHTDLNVKEIAYKMQFPTVSFFCKYVRQHLGASPMELRKKKGVKVNQGTGT